MNGDCNGVNAQDSTAEADFTGEVITFKASSPGNSDTSGDIHPDHTWVVDDNPRGDVHLHAEGTVDQYRLSGTGNVTSRSQSVDCNFTVTGEPQ
jgi:hypothetical protein